MERNRELSLDTKEITEQEPELGHKNRSAVTDDGVREAVMLHHFVDNYFRQFWGIDGDLDWLIMHYFCKPVNDD